VRKTVSHSTMKTVKTAEELETNLKSFEAYLYGNVPDDFEIAATLIKNGNSFIAYFVNGKYLFAPSRYIGYANNSLLAHKNNNKKNGGETNIAISKILGGKPEIDGQLESAFVDFTIEFGITPKKIERRFWHFSPSESFIRETNALDSFPEGKVAESLHKRRERNTQLVIEAKRQFKQQHGRLFCQSCGFDFEKVYGILRRDFIEAHHTVPVSEMQAEHETKLSDLIMLCANCHRMAHRKRPWLTKEQLLSVIGLKQE
jgi:predicted HNH restriction endonuclease